MTLPTYNGMPPLSKPHKPKAPAKTRYLVKRRNGNYYIMRDGIEASCAIHNANEAELRMERMMQKELHVTRKCMCCQGGFLSEGAHNRMCQKCATQSLGMN